MTAQQFPEGWQMVKFGDIAKHISKRVEPSETELDIYVGLEHLDPDSLKIKRHGMPSDVAGQKLLVKKGQIIFGKRRAYQRKVAVADWDCICSAHAMVLEANPVNIVPDFLPFFMQSDAFMNRAIAISEGSLSPTIKWKVLSNQSFLFPAKNIQEKLLVSAKKASEVESLLDEVSRSSTRIYHAVLTDIFRKGLGDPSWSRCELGACSTIQSGLAISAARVFDEVACEIPYLRVANVYDGALDLSEIKKVKATKAMQERYKIEKGDVLIAEGGDFDKVGRGHIWNDEVPGAIHQNHLFAVRLDKDKLLPEFFNYMKSSFIGVKYFLGIAQRTTNLATINSAQLRKFPCAFPSIEKQREIVKQLDAISSGLILSHSAKAKIRSLCRALMEV
ncbi:restriction endonuclease subunit S [Pseudomonas mendocina]|uniref:restriction endonuclease subunit S n=1 Tax=Ectopseudomonas mendocina TaxID=300 RepID=UPI0023DAB90B|nr:restriction endonuclease subunit S [Pseudomonas mendocina]MDF2076749.1 restriction endonuclease subunit S [Pseudomonas mendocina]